MPRPAIRQGHRRGAAGGLGSLAGAGLPRRGPHRLPAAEGVPYFLESNPLPGLSPDSGDLVILAGRAGIAYPELVARILEAAIAHYNLAPEPSLST